MRPSMDPDGAAAPVVGYAYDFEPGEVPAHAHARRAQLVYAVRGAMTVSTDRGRWVLPPGRALWVPPGTLHAMSNARPLMLRTLYFAPDMEGVGHRDDCAVLGVPPLVRELIVASVGLPWTYAADGPEARLVRVLLDRLALLPQEPIHVPEPTDPRARAAADAMRRDPADRRPIGAIAREAGASERTLERLFLRDTGMGVGAWRLRMRMLAALEHLAAGASVASTALDVGYGNASGFIASFRSTFGTTPSRFFEERDPA